MKLFLIPTDGMKRKECVKRDNKYENETCLIIFFITLQLNFSATFMHTHPPLRSNFFYKEIFKKKL